MPRLPLKLVVYLCYQTAVLAVFAFVLYQLRSFDGVIVVEKGRGERRAVQPVQNENSSFAFLNKALPAELLHFDNPKAVFTVLDRQKAYQTTELPFILSLKESRILEEGSFKNELTVEASNERSTYRVEAGDTLNTPEGMLSVGGIEPWSGLVKTAHGTPMAVLTLNDSDAASYAPLFLSPETDLRPEPGLLLRLYLVSNEAEARAAVPKEPPPAPHFRWAVHEDTRSHWFDTVTPGTGLTTGNGTEYTLLAAEDTEEGREPRIHIEKRSGDRRDLIVVDANSFSPDGDLEFQYFNDTSLVLLYAWHDGAVWAATWVNGEKLGEAQVFEGGTIALAPGDSPPRFLKLEQMLLTALPLQASPQGPQALVLNTSSGTVRLRQGSNTTLGTTRFFFHRIEEAPKLQYTLRASFGKRREAQEFSVEPGSHARVDSWLIIHDQPKSGGAAIAALGVRRIVFSLRDYLTAFILYVAMTVILILRFGVLRKKPPAFDTIARDAIPSQEPTDGGDGDTVT
ncbi:MAG: hypothetical protein GX117_08645 [Candidatus Hydrogenedentes bacterium]|nr:hypothetical protein [Candidatus Hydrogenedentota bacterium]